MIVIDGKEIIAVKYGSIDITSIKMGDNVLFSSTSTASEELSNTEETQQEEPQ